MKIDESCINHNAVRLIKELTEVRYDMIESNEEEMVRERGFLLMTLGEINGIIVLADTLKEVLKT